jgi:hypothetical protein
MNSNLTTAQQNVKTALSKASNQLNSSQSKESPYGGFNDATEKVLTDTIDVLDKALNTSRKLNVEGIKKAKK